MSISSWNILYHTMGLDDLLFAAAAQCRKVSQ
jgi:hypothetical protein